ncbi:MAG: RloB domain-containing protein [Elusimicrobia bacterium]|nr:RloB domain-containing protein [Candidatus Obscuribacterium magneticum]
MALHRIRLERKTKKTVLIVGEGETERAFLQHLKESFIQRESDVHVKVECGSGGDPKSVIQKAVRLKSSRSYDECYVLIDSDRPVVLDARLKQKMGRKPGIKILEATPCLEGLLLAIVEHQNFLQKGASSDTCKQVFETNYISSGNKTDKRAYAPKFSRDLIEKRRSALSQLDAILKALQV